MEKVIEKLYEDFLNVSNPSFKDTEERKKTLYNVLFKKLSETERTLLVEYADIQEEQCFQETKNAYEQGFKTAIQLIVECLKI